MKKAELEQKVKDLEEELEDLKGSIKTELEEMNTQYDENEAQIAQRTLLRNQFMGGITALEKLSKDE